MRTCAQVRAQARMCAFTRIDPYQVIKPTRDEKGHRLINLSEDRLLGSIQVSMAGEPWRDLRRQGQLLT